MPSPAVSLKLRKFRRHFGIAAPRMVVRSHVPWQWFLLPGALLALLLVAAFWLLMQRSEAGLVGRELEELRAQFQTQQAELETLRSTAGTRQNAVSIERATQRQLLSRIQELEQENGVLKEDIRIFERLIPVVGDEAALRLENFRVAQDDAGRYRYRLLLAYQPSKQKPEFAGQLQLAVHYLLAGKEHQLLLPEKNGAAPDYQLAVKHFLRREGVFDLPPEARLKAVEARVLQGGTLAGKRLAEF